MDVEELSNPYQAFFIKSEAGKYFIDKLREIIADNHQKAEQQPELSRDFVQRAKGAREALEHIESVVTFAKGAKP